MGVAWDGVVAESVLRLMASFGTVIDKPGRGWQFLRRALGF